MSGLSKLVIIALPLICSFNTLPAAAQESSFEALHIERRGSFRVPGAQEEVFRLLEPRGRKQLLRNWNIDFLHPRSGDARPGAVYRQTHRSGAVTQVWFLAAHDPPRRIKYVMFVAGMEVMEFEAWLEPLSRSETMVKMEHRITSLAEEINTEVQRFADGYEGFIERQRTSMAAALKIGRQ